MTSQCERDETVFGQHLNKKKLKSVRLKNDNIHNQKKGRRWVKDVGYITVSNENHSSVPDTSEFNIEDLKKGLKIKDTSTPSVLPSR